MLEILFVLLFAGHLLLVDVAIAGPLFCVWLDCRAVRKGDRAAAEIGRRLASRALLTVVLGIIAGITLWKGLSFLPSHSRYLQVFDAIPAVRWRAVISELVFYIVVMGLYFWSWDRWTKYRWGHRAIALVAGTTLASHFPPMFVMVSAFATRGEFVGKVLDRGSYWQMLVDPEVVARSAHHFLAALSVVGVIVACKVARRCSGTDASCDKTAGTPPDTIACPSKAQEMAIGVIASRIALFATLLQIPVGIFVLLQLPPLARDHVLGGDAISIALFATAMVTALGLMHHLSSLALGDLRCGQVYRAGILLILTTVLMTGMLHRARTDVFRQFDDPRQAADANGVPAQVLGH